MIFDHLYHFPKYMAQNHQGAESALATNYVLNFIKCAK